MKKSAPSKNTLVAAEVTSCKSTFMLTFAVQIIGIDAWQDSGEEQLSLGPYQQAMKLQYQLYPGQSFELDILIWPHVAKIWCGSQYGYIRTWQFLEERWLTFSIRHAFPVRVHNMINHIVTVTCTMGSGSLGANAKNDKNSEVLLPPLKFGERRYFGPVLEAEETNEQFIQKTLWNRVQEHIPASYLDGIFDTPFYTTDVRHQDTILSEVQESILSKCHAVEDETFPAESEDILINKGKDTKNPKDKKKVVEEHKEKFAIFLSGDNILAGAGRIVAFETIGERPLEQSSIIVIISSNNLPAEDDLPIIFVNVETLHDIPIQELKKLRISQIFTRWKIGEQKHDSMKQNVKLSNNIQINDHHTVPLQYSNASEITAFFLDNPFEIQEITFSNFPLFKICGHQSKSTQHNGSLFGNNKNDLNFGYALPSKTHNPRLDEEVVIAVTKIDASSLAKQTNGFVRGEFCVYPLKSSLVDKDRKDNCTNDVNGIKQPIEPDAIIQPSVILKAQMTLDASIGVVGCRPHRLTRRYLRFYCCARDSQASNSLLQKILEINRNAVASEDINDLLTGFALDTIDEIVFYVEGQKDGPILIVATLSESYPEMSSLYSCSDLHVDRIYTDMLSSDTPFYVLKMLVPLNTLLACPQVYVKPSLPLPTKSALLKIGRLMASKFNIAPYKSEMPTNEELNSFRLELCVPSRPHEDNLISGARN
ncbi:uncharacterized protein LOC112057926 [Bicyclus anynana]|uniref:Uncharacterized protein LOC112057926 n=1 Tax=Bicyclus anynana TaxID=110368 RepID=A0ABM3LPU7_BICAN|nr:uncharacterized protein LOC112057926 [Bicyclus anynana]